MDKTEFFYWDYQINVKEEIPAFLLDEFVNRKRKELDGKDITFRWKGKKEKIVFTPLFVGEDINKAEDATGVSSLFFMCQSLYETNRFYCTGDVPNWKHNPAGIAAYTTAPDKAAKFNSWGEGFLAAGQKITNEYWNIKDWRNKKILNFERNPYTIAGIYLVWSTAPDSHDKAVATYMSDFYNFALSRGWTDFSFIKNGIVPVTSGFEWQVKDATLEVENAKRYDIIVQMGHSGRYTGATGTAGEREFNEAVGHEIGELAKNAIPRFLLIPADPTIFPKTKLLLALHADGSNNKLAKGSSVGYPPTSNPDFAHVIHRNYGELSHFTQRKDNYTRGQSKYYLWRKIKSDYYCLIELGFLTNVEQRTWLLSHTKEIASNLFNTIINFLKEKYGNS